MFQVGCSWTLAEVRTSIDYMVHQSFLTIQTTTSSIHPISLNTPGGIKFIVKTFNYSGDVVSCLLSFYLYVCRYDSSGELSQAFFTPQETTTYVLWLQADNEGELFFGTNANISNVTRYTQLTVTVTVLVMC